MFLLHGIGKHSIQFSPKSGWCCLAITTLCVMGKTLTEFSKYHIVSYIVARRKEFQCPFLRQIVCLLFNDTDYSFWCAIRIAAGDCIERSFKILGVFGCHGRYDVFLFGILFNSLERVGSAEPWSQKIECIFSHILILTWAFTWRSLKTEMHFHINLCIM